MREEALVVWADGSTTKVTVPPAAPIVRLGTKQFRRLEKGVEYIKGLVWDWDLPVYREEA